jgi:gliding motility-associated-like protein
LKNIFNILLLFLVFNLNGQNLIYNGDFEIYDTCPNSLSQTGDYQIEHCLGWYAPTVATSDYFNTCAPWPVSVPNNTMGNISPYSGNAYCGILIEDCKRANLCSAYWGIWIEYIQSKLIQKLDTGHEYEFSCRVARTNKNADYAFSEFGALFTSDSLLKNNARPIPYFPQIKNPIGNYLSDTTWIEFNGKFIANGNEEYITLGFFIDTLNLDTLNVANNWIVDPLHYGTYYFIDDTKLFFTGNIYQLPNIFSPNGDGINDVWRPYFIEEGDIISIYNRWGTKIYSKDYPEIYWNGKNNMNELCNSGTYYFIIEKLNSDKVSGIISLIY